RALPVIAALEHNEDMPGIETPLRFLRIRRQPWQPEPHDIHRRTEVLASEPCGFAECGRSSVGCNDEIGSDRQRPFGSRDFDARYAPAVIKKIRRLGVQPERKFW